MWTVVVAAMLLAGVAVAVLMARGQPGEGRRPGGGTSGAETGSDAADRLPWSPPRAGMAMTYDLSANAESRADLSSVMAAKSSAGSGFSGQVQVSGRLSLALVSEGAGGALLLAARLDEAQVQVKMNGAGGLDEELAREVSRWSFARLDRRGRVQAVSAPPKQAAAASGLMASLYAALQIVLPADADADADAGRRWTVEEQDLNGRYIAAYQVEQASTREAVKLRKQKARYLPPPLQPGDTTAAYELAPSGQMLATLGRQDGVVVSIDSDETLITQVDGRPVGSTRTRLRFKLRRQRRIPTTLDQELRRLARLAGPGRPLFRQGSDPAMDAAEQRVHLGDHTAADLLPRLKGDLAALTAEESGKLALALEALVYLHPGTADEVVRAVKGLRSSDALRLAADALACAGHARAQAALLGLLEARAKDVEALAVLVPILGRIAKPSPEVEAALRRLAAGADAGIASMARLALGVTARNLLRFSAERAGRIVRWAAENLERTGPGKDQGGRARHWLHVLGNAGMAAPEAAMLRHGSDPRTPVRTAAHWALRFIHTPAARSQLAQALLADKEAEVRAAAARALGFHRLETSGAVFEALKRTLLGDPDVIARRAAFNTLTRSRKHLPAVSPILRKVAANDPNMKLREAATRVLSETQSRPTP